MNALAPRSRIVALVIGGIALILMLAAGSLIPTSAAAGWLIAFATAAAILFGSVALLAIHTLTGGRWGDLARPAFEAAAALAPAGLIFFIPLALTARFIYPWATNPQSAGAGVARLFLNVRLFAAGGLVFIAGLALLARLARSARLAPLTAALGLVWYAVGMNLLAFAWLSSIEPRYVSSAFGAQIIIGQITAGLAFAILATEADRNDTAWGDLGALLLAALLGETYLILMTFLIDWYGDLSSQAEWYLRRAAGSWVWLEAAGAVTGSFAPLIALLFSRVRNSAPGLKIAGAAALLGVFIENIWLVAPVAGPWSAPLAALALVAIGGLALGSADVFAAIVDRGTTAHGV